MKKRMVLSLLGFALATTAFVSTPAVVEASLRCPTQGFACFVGPICCSNLQCASYCQNLSPGSTPHCSGSAGNPGCCSCGPAVE